MLGIERLLDLLELALLVLRKRHGASQLLSPACPAGCWLSPRIRVPARSVEGDARPGTRHRRASARPRHSRTSASLPPLLIRSVRSGDQGTRPERARPEPAGDLVHRV